MDMVLEKNTTSALATDGSHERMARCAVIVGRDED